MVGRRHYLEQKPLDEKRHAALDVDDVSCEQVDIVVAHIKRIVRMAGLEFALHVGAVIIHHFYNGDANAWRSRGPKAASFRSLAQHPELPMSAGFLYRCVALYELCDRLNAPSRWEHLGASHLRLVIGLPCDLQEKLLATANAKRWTVKVLQEEVRRDLLHRRVRGGRRAQSVITKNLLSASRCVADCGADELEHLSLDDLERSIQLIEETKCRLERLSQSLLAARQTGAEFPEGQRG